jgi:hypothetical protein
MANAMHVVPVNAIVIVVEAAAVEHATTGTSIVSFV